MKKRTLRALLLALTGIAATAHCGKGTPETTGGVPLGPTDVVVTWTFAGKAASADECKARGGSQVVVTMSATANPDLHQHATADCAAGKLTFKALDTGSLGTPFVEGALLDDKGVAVTDASTTITPMAGTTPAVIDFFPILMTTAAATTADAASSGATSGGGGMGGMAGTSGSSAASTTGASSSASASAASSGSGSGGAGGK